MRKILFLIAIVILALSSSAQWNSTKYESQYNYGIELISLDDDEFVVAGGGGASYYDSDLWLTKYDFEGTELWHNTVEGENTTGASGIIKTSDDGFLVFGENGTDFQGNGNYFAIKFDENGDTVWTSKFTRDHLSSANAAIEVSDGYVLVGREAYPESQQSTNGYNLMVVKYNLSGDTLWTSKVLYQDGKQYLPHYIGHDGNGGFNIVAENNALTLINVSSLGEYVSKEVIQYHSNSSYTEIAISSVKDLEDGNILITGASFFEQDFTQDFLMVKINKGGDLLWSQVYKDSKGDSRARGFRETNDGGLIIVGHCKTTYLDNSGYPNKCVWLMKTDANGDSTWTKNYEHPTSDSYGFDVIQQSGGGFVIAASSYGSENNQNLWLIGTDENGNSETNINEVSENFTRVYPSITSGDIKIEMPFSLSEKVEVTIFNAIGQVVVDTSPTEIDHVTLPNAKGMYYVLIASVDFKEVHKVVKE